MFTYLEYPAYGPYPLASFALVEASPYSLIFRYFTVNELAESLFVLKSKREGS